MEPHKVQQREVLPAAPEKLKKHALLQAGAQLNNSIYAEFVLEHFLNLVTAWWEIVLVKYHVQSDVTEVLSAAACG